MIKMTNEETKIKTKYEYFIYEEEHINKTIIIDAISTLSHLKRNVDYIYLPYEQR